MKRRELKVSVSKTDKTGTNKAAYIQEHGMSSFTQAEISDTDGAEWLTECQPLLPTEKRNEDTCQSVIHSNYLSVNTFLHCKCIHVRTYIHTHTHTHIYVCVCVLHLTLKKPETVKHPIINNLII